jgi:hypothetical protein
VVGAGCGRVRAHGCPADLLAECQVDSISFITPNDFRPQQGWQVIRARVPPELIWHRGDLPVTCPAHGAVDLAVARLQAFAHDRRRRNALVLTAYVVLNFTWAQVFGDPESASRPSGER